MRIVNPIVRGHLNGVEQVFGFAWRIIKIDTPSLKMFIADGEPPPVWPDPEGEVRGMAFSPLYKSVPKAAQRGPKLYELLVLVVFQLYIT